MQRPYLIFDKSSLESLNIDEAVLLDTFFSCVITPIFFVECLADLEKQIRSKSTPEQLVGSLADRTPEYESCVTLHHLDVLRWELTGKFSLLRLKGGPFVAGAKSVQLGDQSGVIFQRTKEMEGVLSASMREWCGPQLLGSSLSEESDGREGGRGRRHGSGADAIRAKA